MKVKMDSRMESRTVFLHGLVGTAVAVFAILALGGVGHAQRIQNTSDGTLSATLNFGTLTPGLSNTPASTSVQFRLRSSNTTGYHVRVNSATLTATPTSSTAGGTTISASDIGVGITAVTTAPGFNGISPRSDVIATGFNYDPAAVTATNGLSPYVGMASGQATLQDVINNPNVKILSGNRIHSNTTATGTTNYLTVTLRFGVLRQFVTPANISGTITLEVVNGQ
jgi:hypothetical protein